MFVREMSNEQQTSQDKVLMHTWQLGRHDDLRRMDMYIDTDTTI